MQSESHGCSNIVSDNLYLDLLGLAQQIASNMNIVLDYSNESIGQVEFVLGLHRDEFLRTKSDEGLKGIALELGAYIIETIRRNNSDPGVWYTDHNELGEKCFPFVWKGQTLFPYAWCEKRIFDGPGDNVMSKYEALILQNL